MEHYLEFAEVCKALGDPKRAMIVDMLSCGEMCACQILEKFNMSQPTLSHHMKNLCACGLVRSREQGKWTFYYLDAGAVNRVKQVLETITSDKEHCICRETADHCAKCAADA